MRSRAGLILAAVLLGCFAGAGQQPTPTPTFGTTVVVPAGLRGDVYLIPHNSASLPDFSKLAPVGAIYTSSLAVPPTDFRAGFPGVTDRFEWFAINYTGRFWIEKPGMYLFVLTSDDGARLYVDGQLIADNDGTHQVQDRVGTIRLAGGIHRIRVAYFQGPRFTVALTLQVAGPGERLRVFSTEEFKPPANPEDWRFPGGGAAGDTEPADAFPDAGLPPLATLHPSLPETPLNLGFAGRAGEAPQGWQIPELQAALGYKAEVRSQGCQHGPMCAVLLVPPNPRGEAGILMQQFHAGRFRGRKVRLRASLRLESPAEGARAQMWIRTELQNQSMVGFADDMHDRPVVSEGWTRCEIRGKIDRDAASISIGFLAAGRSAAVWVDNVSIEIE